MKARDNNIYPMEPLGRIVSPIERREAPIPGKVYRQIGVRLWGEGAYEREPVDGGQTKYKTLSRVEVNDIIVNKIWARNGSVAVVPENLAGCYGSNEFPTFTPVKDSLHHRWFHWFTKTKDFWMQCDEKSRGTSGKNRIRPERFLEIEIPLPPLTEQRRIVARIEELAARIEEARGLRRQALEEAEAILGAATLPIFDNNYEAMTSVEQMVGRSNLRNGKSLKTTDETSEVSCLTLSSLRQGAVDCNNVKPVPMTEAEARPFLVRSQDVFIVRGNGSKQLVGQAGLVQDQPERVIFPDLFIKVPLDADTVMPRFFVAMWNSKQMRDNIETTAKTTSGIWKINQGHIASFSVPLPPISEQRRIVAYLDDLQAKVDSLKQLQAETAAELDALLPSVLDRAFKGEL